MKRIHLLSTISLFITGLASPTPAQTAEKPVELTPTERVAHSGSNGKLPR